MWQFQLAQNYVRRIRSFNILGGVHLLRDRLGERFKVVEFFARRLRIGCMINTLAAEKSLHALGVCHHVA